jgi:hypothetical protein
MQLGLLHMPGVVVDVIDDGGELVDLVAGAQHGGMGAVEIVEMPDQRVNAFGHRFGLQHVLADELGQVAD